MEQEFLEACDNDDQKLVLKFIKKGVNVNVQDEEGYTAMIYMAPTNNIKVIKALLEEGADVNIQNEYGGTALMSVAEQANDEIDIYNHLHEPTMNLLIVKGKANLNLQDKNGNTALMCAMIEHNILASKKLIYSGTDIYLENKEGLSAGLLASKKGLIEILEYMLDEEDLNPNKVYSNFNTIYNIGTKSVKMYLVNKYEYSDIIKLDREQIAKDCFDLVKSDLKKDPNSLKGFEFFLDHYKDRYLDTK